MQLVGYGMIALHFLGVLSAIHAIMKSRASQAAAAWAISLVTFPYLILPLYWLFGIYRESTTVDIKALRAARANVLVHKKTKEGVGSAASSQERLQIFEKLGETPQSSGNQASLLIDGEETFSAIFESMRSARDYILVEFFIVEPDELGHRLKDLMMEKAKAGVRVYFLFDPVGSHKMTRKYLKQLIDAGVKVLAFKVRERVSRLQVNFRNHRKIVVVDGDIGFVGGHNVSNEYLGKSKRFGHWRDTHVKLAGPVVSSVQAGFASDWYLTTEELLNLNWQAKIPQLRQGNESLACVVVSSDPLEGKDLAGMCYTQAINMAEKRIWISSPYFIPDEKIMAALRLRALAGVDVRLLIPSTADHFLVFMAAYSYLDDLRDSGIKVFRYTKGFVHQKVMLIDDDLSCVGTANLDNRSFHLNFEQMVLICGRSFNECVQKMLEQDFNASTRLMASEYRSKDFFQRLAIRVSRLFSPIL